MSLGSSPLSQETPVASADCLVGSLSGLFDEIAVLKLAPCSRCRLGKHLTTGKVRAVEAGRTEAARHQYGVHENHTLMEGPVRASEHGVY